MIETNISAASSPSTNGSHKKHLIPRSISVRRRRKSLSSGHSSGNGSLNDTTMSPQSRGRDVRSRDAPDGSDGDESLSQADERGAAAGASATDLPLPAPLSSHPSQIGYLTTSSPLVQAEYVHGVRTPTQSDYERLGRTSTLSAKPTNSGAFVPTSTVTIQTGLAPPPSKVRRSPSPAGRFRDVFKSRKSSSTANSSPERERQHPDHNQLDRSIKSPETRNPNISAAPSPVAPPPVQTPIPDASSAEGANHNGEPSDASRVKAADRFRRLSKGQKIETGLIAVRPETPPSSETSAPVIVNTPPTPTESIHPVALSGTRHRASPGTATLPSIDAPNASPAASISSSSMISQRRARAGSLGPSKLSNYTLAPISPNPDYGQAGQTTPSSGFFSSMFSVAQNATNSLSNAVTNTNISSPWNSNNKKPGTTTSGREYDADDGQEAEGVEVESSLDLGLAPSLTSSQPKEPAVKTLGLGDLSLSQLGIIDQPEEEEETKAAVAIPPAAHVQSRMSEGGFESRRRSESAPADPSILNNPSEQEEHGADDAALLAVRPLSVSDGTGHEDGTPPTTSINGDKEKAFALHRSGSAKSAHGRRRGRNSSAAKGGASNTIAAAVAAANLSGVNPTVPGNAPKLTGFAVASKKRNREFHNLFKSVPDDDYLIEDYSCALQREILAHGRLYVSEGYICFSSNILGWVTTLVMSFDEVVSVEKRSTALVFKNGLMISTLHAKHIFASFASRDSTYDLIVKIWKLGHPSLQSSLNGVHIDETGGDKTEKIEDRGDVSVESRSLSASEDESEDDSDEVYDEDAEDEDMHETAYVSDAGGAAADTGAEKAVTRKTSGTASNGAAADKPKDATAPAAGGDFPGPLTHAATDCGDTGSHYDRILADDVIGAPLGKVFGYVFGATSATWMIKWLSNDQKCLDVQVSDKKGLGPDNKTRTISYVKPLNAPIGPKQTKCIVTETVEAIDFDKAINVTCATQTPDVPSGNVFTVKTKYCFSWAENNATRVQINCTIEWTGKSWLKAPIEKGANDGQTQYSKDLFASLKEALLSSSRSRAVAGEDGPGAKGRKKGRKGKPAPLSGPTREVESVAKKPEVKADWGPLEPVRGLVEPLMDVVQPLLTGNVMYGLLVGLLVAAWFGFGLTSRRQPPMGQPGQLGYGGSSSDLGYRAAYPERVAAYDEIWQREESELWSWLEERVGLDRRMDGASAGSKRGMDARVVQDKLHDDPMDSRDIQEAIRVTEEKLRVLRSVVERQAGGSA
ncbi:gram domain containing protein [Grosmannia clavigera kw1407]|uniref:Gram domain containing protein n=1 Tax=Grosmannia clavigera (strain kw1407 / UAMH 11150) TaxID=655863 RepID=F0X8L0_GROCL|nr:gram domain containing protein [Grosmannia clavigera kw1407]EFX05740.1 gram domain containing protein [Grosmannia clavigera kw1407]